MALTLAHAALALLASTHALLNKHDPRSAWVWITACCLLPAVGVLLYWWFGINRVERRARSELGLPLAPAARLPDDLVPSFSGVSHDEVSELVHLGGKLSGRQLLAGNRITPLFNGDVAYPAMIVAIDAARTSVWLMSYIFDADTIGLRFAHALARAVERKVEVRVLLDGVGDLARGTRGSKLLRSLGIPVHLFMPLGLFPPLLHINMRNHRKLLCIDQGRAFVGGINIGDHHLLRPRTRRRLHLPSARTVAADLHFGVEGPVARQLAEVFADDWQTSGGEPLDLSDPASRPCGTAYARALADGPNGELRRIQLLMAGAIANAHHRVLIMTPYFIPSPELAAALTTAALRGVAVAVLLPERGDHPWLDAASRRWLGQLIHHGVQIRLRPPPFAHSKLFLVDDYYALVGSANLDPRSLRLNFELMLEAYDRALVALLTAHYESVARTSPLLSEAQLHARPFHARLLDSICWLLSPYL